MTWSTPPFSTLPVLEGTECRWVGATVMDEEEYRVSRYECRVIGDGTYWRASIAGMEEYARLRKGRRDQRKRMWQEREEAEQSYTDWVNSDPRVQA